MTNEPIQRFTGSFGFLSNFAASPLVYLGDEYQTVEHAFQAAKAIHPAHKEEIRCAMSPGEAKRLGRKLKMTDQRLIEWEHLKEIVMLDILRLKFKPGSDLAAKLIGTGTRKLIEGNTWGDRYWGVCNGEGKNRLGELLMQVRNELNGDEL